MWPGSRWSPADRRRNERQWGDSETSVVNMMVVGVGGSPLKDVEDVLPGFHTVCTSFSLVCLVFFFLV